jgi:(R)-benzylsuccinyl-CoA dehydrogenase
MSSEAVTLLDPDETKLFRETVRQFVESELIPLERLVIEREAERGLNSGQILPPEVLDRIHSRAKELDLWGIDVPKEYGGLGLGAVAKMILVEEFNRSIVPLRLPPESPNLKFLESVCTPEQREKYLLPYAAAETRSSLALTEPGAGSDVSQIQTTAVRADGGWVINGSKIFITNADIADFFIVIAVTDPVKRARGGMTAFFVDKGTPGLTVGKHTATMGADVPYDLYFDDMFVPDDHVAGEVGKAFVPLSNRLGIRRIEISARCVGMGERLLDMMVEQAKSRETFGKPLAARQAIQWWIADTQIELHAARLMVEDAAAKLDSGVTDIRREASATKVFCTEMIGRIVDRAMQLFGGMGYTKELPIEWIYRNSRVLRIVEGASEVHRMQLARHRLGDAAR